MSRLLLFLSDDNPILFAIVGVLLFALLIPMRLVFPFATYALVFDRLGIFAAIKMALIALYRINYWRALGLLLMQMLVVMGVALGLATIVLVAILLASVDLTAFIGFDYTQFSTSAVAGIIGIGGFIYIWFFAFFLTFVSGSMMHAYNQTTGKAK